MVKQYYKLNQSVTEWVDTIQTKFNYVKIDEYQTIADALGIENAHEIAKIKEALLIVYGKKLGVLSYEDACKKNGIDSVNLISTNDSIHVAAYKKLEIIIKAINNGWTPDWSNNSQNKYYPWFRIVDGAFVYRNANYDDSSVNVPSALCLCSAELCYYVGNRFIGLYKDLYL